MLNIKQRGQRKQKERVKPWYHEEIAAAHLPTSEISEDAMQAGLEYARTGISAKKKATQKSVASKQPVSRRETKPTFETGKGLVISKEAALALIAAGARDTTNGQLRTIDSNSSSLPLTNGHMTQSEVLASTSNHSMPTAEYNGGSSTRLIEKGPSSRKDIEGQADVVSRCEFVAFIVARVDQDAEQLSIVKLKSFKKLYRSKLYHVKARHVPK